MTISGNRALELTPCLLGAGAAAAANGGPERNHHAGGGSQQQGSATNDDDGADECGGERVPPGHAIHHRPFALLQCAHTCAYGGGGREGGREGGRKEEGGRRKEEGGRRKEEEEEERAGGGRLTGLTLAWPNLDDMSRWPFPLIIGDIAATAIIVFIFPPTFPTDVWATLVCQSEKRGACKRDRVRASAGAEAGRDASIEGAEGCMDAWMDGWMDGGRQAGRQADRHV